MIHICNLIVPSLKNEKDVVSPCDGGDDRFTASIHITACCIRKGGNVDTYIYAFIDWFSGNMHVVRPKNKSVPWKC